MANPNIVNVSSIYGQSAVQAITTSATAIVTASSGTIVKINSLNISNISSSAATITVDLYRSATATRLAYQITVAAYSTLVVLTKDNGIYLMESDALRLTASANTALEGVCSYEVIS